MVNHLSKLLKVTDNEYASVVEDGIADGLSLRSWSYVPGSAGRISFVSFGIPEWFDGEDWRRFLVEWAELLPRCPWKWSFMERSIIGALLPEFRRSRKAFSREGINIKSWKGVADESE